MEPIVTFEGYQVQQNAEQSRDLLSDYYRRQGYTVVTPKTEHDREPVQQSSGEAKTGSAKG